MLIRWGALFWALGLNEGPHDFRYSTASSFRKLSDFCFAFSTPFLSLSMTLFFAVMSFLRTVMTRRECRERERERKREIVKSEELGALHSQVQYSISLFHHFSLLLLFLFSLLSSSSFCFLSSSSLSSCSTSSRMSSNRVSSRSLNFLYLRPSGNNAHL